MVNLKRLRDSSAATKKSMEERVAKWQHVLGLDDWDILIKWDISLNDDEAEADPGKNYKYATLRLSEKWPYWTEEWADKTILHELWHIKMRDLDTAAKALDEVLTSDAYKIHEQRYDHEAESFVDVAATIIYRLYQEV